MKKMYIAPEFKFWSAEELNSIEAKMSGASSSMIGDESRPFKFSGTTTIPVNGLMDYWLKCTIDGAAKFAFEISQESEVAIYRSANNLLDSFEVESGYYIIYKNGEIRNGENTYLIRLRGNSATTTVFTVTARQNRDSDAKLSRNSSNIIKWVPSKGSVVPSNIFTYNWIYYAKGDAVYVLEKIIEDDTYLKAIDNASYVAANVMAVLIGNTEIGKLVKKFGKTALGKAIIPICDMGASITGINPLQFLTSLRFLIKNKIEALGTFDEGTLKYPKDKGIYIDVHYIRVDHPEIVTDVGTWSGNTVYGARGMTGKWEIYSGEV